MKSLFFVSALLKMHFSMKVFVFLTSGLLKIDFLMTVLVFLGLMPIENGFFNESVGFFGFSDCGRRCCVFFFI